MTSLDNTPDSLDGGACAAGDVCNGPSVDYLERYPINQNQTQRIVVLFSELSGGSPSPALDTASLVSLGWSFRGTANRATLSNLEFHEPSG